VEAGPSGGARVCDWRARGGLDLLSDLAAVGEVAPLLGAVAEMRACLGADAARLCAARGTAALRGELPALARAIPSPVQARRYQDRFAAYERLWARIVDGSGNVVYRLGLNTLMAARVGGGVDPRAFAAEVDDPGATIPLAEAIADADPERARRLAFELLQRTVQAV
jgi:DNA-binding FadR family transcriptional regulator